LVIKEQEEESINKKINKIRKLLVCWQVCDFTFAAVKHGIVK
jgi:hypothetical protein